jgi:hypothetical protein
VNTDMTDELFFGAEMLRTSLENNSSILKLIAKSYHNFKVIEVINEFEVKEHFNFVHPFYGLGHY